MKNKHVLLIPIIFFCVYSFAFGYNVNNYSQTDLFNEIKYSYQGKNYPSVIENSVLFEKNYPRSLHMGQVQVQKGESLYHLGRITEAIIVFNECIKLNKNNNYFLLQSYYWKGMCLFLQENYTEALTCFDSACNVYFIEKNKTTKFNYYNNRAILYAAESLKNIGSYDKSISLYEYVISNGTEFDVTEYENAFIGLFTSYDKTEQFERLLDVYKKISNEGKLLLSDVYDNLTLLAGDCYLKLGKFKESYECYSEVVIGTREDLASVALQKSYVLASDYPKEVGEDPTAVLAAAEMNLFEYPELINEFWVRLGIDAYNEEKFSKAEMCFDKAEENPNTKYLALIGIYRASLSLKKTKNVNESIKILDSYKSKVDIEQDIYSASLYDYSYAKYYSVLQNWTEADKYINLFLSREQNNQLQKKEILYWNALSAYMKFDYDKVIYIIKNNQLMNFESQILYARALYKTGHGLESEQLFYKLNTNQKFSDIDRLDYAKIALMNNNNVIALNIAAKIKSPKLIQESLYIVALASFNRNDWIIAEQNFIKYLKNPKDNLKPYAMFYCGYAQYRMGKIVEAYKMLSAFTEEYPSHKYAWNAYMTSAYAAIQNKRFDYASKSISDAVLIAPDESSLQKSVILNADILSDSGDYTGAIKTLAPFTKRKDDFGITTRFRTAQFLADQGQIDQADKMYASVVDEYKDNLLSEDAAYRRGELFYTIGEYKTATEKFELYRKQFGKGRYTDASLFYEADSLSKYGENSLSIIMYETLLNTLPESDYCYSAIKNLITLYKFLGQFQKAMDNANILMQDYKENALKDGIPSQIVELNRLLSGEDEKIVKQRIRFEKAGGIDSREGRDEGTILAGMLWRSASTQEESITLAQNLFAIQTKKVNETTECNYAAQNSLLIAQYKKNKGLNKEAAEQFLLTAQYARMGAGDNLAQRALYSAAEAFDAAGMNADSQDAALLLSKLYPDSEYVVQVKKLIEKR